MKIFKLFIIIFTVLLAFILVYLYLSPYLQLDFIKQKFETLSYYHELYPFLSLMIFVIIFAILTAFALPTLIPFILLSGYFLPPYFAAFICSISLTLASLIIYFIVTIFNPLLSKTWLFKRIQQFQLAKNNEVFFLLRSLPMLPFFGVSVLFTLSNISLGRYLFATFIGSHFYCFIFASFGQELSRITHINELFSLKIILLFSSLFVMGLLGILIKQKILKK